MGLYHPNLDRILISYNKDEIANNPGICLAAVRLIQANIIQACHQFQAIHDQIFWLENAAILYINPRSQAFKMRIMTWWQKTQEQTC